MYELWEQVFNDRMKDLLDPKKKKKKHQKTIFAIRSDPEIGKEVAKAVYRMRELKFAIKGDCWYINVNHARMLTAIMED